MRIPNRRNESFKFLIKLGLINNGRTHDAAARNDTAPDEGETPKPGSGQHCLQPHARNGF